MTGLLALLKLVPEWVWVALALLAGGLVYGSQRHHAGYSDGYAEGSAVIQSMLDTRTQELATANATLAADSARFAEITAQTDASVAAAAAQKARGEALAAQSVAERNAMQRRLDKLQTDLLAEQSGCIDGNRPICGVPLE